MDSGASSAEESDTDEVNSWIVCLTRSLMVLTVHLTGHRRYIVLELLILVNGIVMSLRKRTDD